MANETVDETSRRLQSEQNFFDEEVERETSTLQYSEALLRLLDQEAEKFFPDLQDKDVLFYGCGVNWVKSYSFYSRGARIQGIDISGASIQKMQLKAREEGVQDRMQFQQMDCEHLTYPDESFDVIYGRAILHHLDMETASREALRVLKKGGTAIFIEPLGMNPLLNLYRRLTPSMRTIDEKPLTYKDIRLLGRGFSHVKYKEMTFSALSVLAWQRVLHHLGVQCQTPELRFFSRLDEKLFQFLPFLRALCWNVILVFRR